MAFVSNTNLSFVRMLLHTFSHTLRMSVCSAIFILTAVLLAMMPSVEATDVSSDNEEGTQNQSDVCGKISTTCEKGVFLPAWLPTGQLSVGDRVARATVYMVAMIYMFLGVSIIADRFMASIEVITSKEKEVVFLKSNGEKATVRVRIWNETVSNLTLMALGSSAPEILLSIIEIIGRDFKAGELGPSTIVGSAAFNLFVIIAICVYSIPKGEVRRIKHLRVFFITASWSVFAYMWLFFIISISSKGKVEVWEAVLTFLFFPMTVATAYIADKKIFYYKFLSKRYHASMTKPATIQSEGADAELADGKAGSNHFVDEVTYRTGEGEEDDVKEFEMHRKEYIEILRELRKKSPNIDMKTLEDRAEFEAINRGPKSRAFYRIQATRKLTGGGNIIKKAQRERRVSLQDVKVEEEDDGITKISFDPCHYTVMENVGTFYLTVSREGGDLSNTIYVDYKTEDGSANAGSDFEYTEGTLVFHPDEVHKQFPVVILDDEIFEEDEHFYVRLSNVRIGSEHSSVLENGSAVVKAQLVTPALATVMILDDDHPGIFLFEEAEITTNESCGDIDLKVIRSSGARGSVRLPFKTMDGSAKGGKDYQDMSGDLIFENDETEKIISIHIVDDEEYEKTECFYVNLFQPELVRKGSGKISEDEMALQEDESLKEIGMPRLGDITQVVIHIKESAQFKGSDRSGIQRACAYILAESQDNKSGIEGQILLAHSLTFLHRWPASGSASSLETLTRRSSDSSLQHEANVVDKLLTKASQPIVVGTTSWREQFVAAITVSAGKKTTFLKFTTGMTGSLIEPVIPVSASVWRWSLVLLTLKENKSTFSRKYTGDEDDDSEDAEEKLPSCLDYVMHFLTIFWKLLFAFVPPTDILGGWACFTISILTIGLLTGIIGDLASHFGCTVGLKDAVTAITFVALGTSVPDTFASKSAAVNDKYADSSIGNVTGSNAVNVFLGIGVAWTIAAVYHEVRGEEFTVDPGMLAFSVTIFCIFALVAIFMLLIRRRPSVGGELGGPGKYRAPTSFVLLFLWMMYIILSSLVAYCHISGF